MFPYHASHPDRMDVIDFNDDDPDAFRYSILHKLEQFRLGDIFHLKICYPEYADDFPCNEWTQSSNFLTKEEVSNFKPVKITYPRRSRYDNGRFQGLKQTQGWYRNYMVSTAQHWDYGIGYGWGRPSFRGPVNEEGNLPYATKIDLFALVGNQLNHFE